MDSAPVTMMTTIHSLHAEDLKYRWHPGQKTVMQQEQIKYFKELLEWS